MKPLFLAASMMSLTIVGCSTAPVAAPSAGHLKAEIAPPKTSIPPPVQTTATLSKPKPAPKVETYSVVVNSVRVQDLLFALARDAKVNVDIHPGINGVVTLNAIDQTLQQLLTRIAKQVDMRWELEGSNLAIMPDSPYLHTYKADYVNMSRDTSGTVAITTQVASTGGAAGASASGGGGSASAGGNNSQTKIDNKAQHHFWETLEKNVKDILRETDKILPEGSSETMIERADQQATTGTGSPWPGGRASAATQAGIAGSPNPATLQQTGTTVVKRTTFREAASVIVNPEAGIVTVRATSRQHEKIQEFLSAVMASARRQVMIEATVAEVSLADNFQQGIDWSAAPLGRAGFTLVQQAVGGITAPASSIVQLAYANAASRVGNISATVKLLDAFGTVKVLSSPKLSVMNNQTAVLKVVDNLVYFTIQANTTTNQTTTTTTYTTNLNSVPVGLVMNVTPQVSESDVVLLNIRPSISRKFGEVIDPNPDLQKLGVKNAIPVIRTREMESMIRVENGNIAVMGGLMEDSLENNDNTVPGVSGIPLIGKLFQNRDDTRRKTELVVFLRPIIIKDASVDGDYASFRDKLPGQDFFDRNLGPNQRIGSDGGGQ
ncbi:MAG TPA: pilus (MSHA type) biogenesis protein MshL [Rhodocyclaceae bacterium]|nr:pilus (MSHA type) biogenesis protein MshL [Rhodocyclaceae bacterium]